MNRRLLLVALLLLTINCCFSQNLGDEGVTVIDDVLILSDSQKSELQSIHHRFTAQMRALTKGDDGPKGQKIKLLKGERDSSIRALLGTDYVTYIKQTRFSKAISDSLKNHFRATSLRYRRNLQLNNQQTASLQKLFLNNELEKRRLVNSPMDSKTSKIKARELEQLLQEKIKALMSPEQYNTFSSQLNEK